LAENFRENQKVGAFSHQKAGETDAHGGKYACNNGDRKKCTTSSIHLLLLSTNSYFDAVHLFPIATVDHMLSRGRTHLLLAFVVRPLTTHPFRDGAPLSRV
ncbi:unnamed protein product, partial [Sphacelaria rigidula]